MIRNAPGQEVSVTLLNSDGSYHVGTNDVSIMVKRRGLSAKQGQGTMEMVFYSGFVYYPIQQETDTEQVTFFFTGSNILPQDRQFEPKPGIIEPPKSLTGKEAISRIELLEMIATVTPMVGTELWLEALMQSDPIPLSPKILSGLNRAFPSLFKLIEE